MRRPRRELVRLEGDLKKLLPTLPDRVAAYLAATRPNRSPAVDEPPPPATTGTGASAAAT